MSDKIPIGISACLLGKRVRFDAGHKRLPFALDELAPYVHFTEVCPEMGIGLPSPRPALRLVKRDEQLMLLTSSDEKVDFTQQMQDFAQDKVSHLTQLCGFLVCAKSPSCGMERVKVYYEQGVRKSGRGLFTTELMKKIPWLPVEEDGRLHDPYIKENFVARLYALHEFNQRWQEGLTRSRLIEYHSCYKLLLLSHSPFKYLELGRFVAGIDQWKKLDDFAFEYRHRLMALMCHQTSRRSHTNVLQHIQGYFKRHLTTGQREALSQLILSYRQGTQPLLAPITLLRHYLREYPDSYLTKQRYFEPYPEALRLRYGH